MTRWMRDWVGCAVAEAAIAVGLGACGLDFAGDRSDPDPEGVTQEIAGPAPDYIVSGMTEPPAAALNGGSFSLSATVHNIGDAAAVASSTTQFFLSSDPTIGGDQLFGQSSTVPPLAIGAANTQAVTLKVPGVPSGAYYVLACADRKKKVPELDDRNNCRASAGTVDVTGPDLVVELADPPAEVDAGTVFAVTDTTRNDGTTAAVSSTVAYFLSATPVHDALSKRLLPNRTTGPIGAGQASTGTVSVTVPPMAPGSYYLVACADFTKKVAEGSETNNCTTAAGTTTIPIADLSISSVGDPPASVVAGEGGFSVAETTTNTGNRAAPPSITRFVLSLDELPGDDVPLGGSRILPEVAPAGSSTGTTSITTDYATPPADYFVLACADTTGVVPESSEANNCRASATRVTVSEPVPADVTVRLIGRVGYGLPGAGVPVLVHARDGSLVARVATDANAAAAVTVPGGGSVTVVEREDVGDARFLTTFRGVGNGDELIAGDLGWPGELIGEATVAVPGPLPPDTEWSVAGPCAGSGSAVDTTEVSVSLVGGCGAANRPMLGLMFDLFSPYTFRGYLFDPDVLLAPGGTASMDAEWVPPVPFSVALTGMPIDLPAEFTAGRSLGSRVFWGGQSSSIAVSGGEGAITFPGVSEGDGLLTQLQFRGTTSSGSFHEIVEYRVTEEDSLVEDVADDLLAMPTDGFVLFGELEPGGDPEVVGVGWDMIEGASVDGMVLSIRKVTPVGYPMEWTVVTPRPTAGVNELFLPKLPADLVSAWAGGFLNGLHVWTADTLAESYSEFVRDAQPQYPYRWRWWLPATPGKVRLAGFGF